MRTASEKMPARIFSVVDSLNGEMSGAICLKLASWARAGGLNALVLDASGHAIGEMRKLGDLPDHASTLKDEFLRGYLEIQGGFGAVCVDAPLKRGVAASFSRSYDILIAALSPGSLADLAAIYPGAPALVVTSAANGGMAKTASLIDGMFGKKGLPGPMAFVLMGGDAHTGARLAERLRIPYWGDAGDIDGISARALERAMGTRYLVEEEAPASAKANERPPRDQIKGPFDDIAIEIVEALRRDASLKDLRAPASGGGARDELKEKVSKAARRMIHSISPARLLDVDIESLIRRAVEDSVGYGPVESLMSDPRITEIMINGPEEVYVERDGVIFRTQEKFADSEHLTAVVERMLAGAGRRVDESSPMVDARLRDGSRLNVIIPPVAIGGPAVTIRKFAARMKETRDAVSGGMFTERIAGFFEACVRSRASIVVSGGTGAGKTTLLNILASAIGGGERVVTIEDAAELSLSARHVVRLEARPPNIEGSGAVSIRDLVKNALRMRPDRIVVGECRGAEALDMLQAMNTGHDGSLTTVHANSPRDAISRIETMVLMAGVDLPLATVREQIVRAIDIIVQVEREKGGRRIVSEIVELTGLEGQTPNIQTIARLDSSGKLSPTGLVPKFAENLNERELFVSLLCGGV